MREDTVEKLLELVTQGDAAREKLDEVINEIWNHICIISKPYEFEANKKFPYIKLNPYGNLYGEVDYWKFFPQEDEIELKIRDTNCVDNDSFDVRIPTYWLWFGKQGIELCVKEAWEKAVNDNLEKATMKVNKEKEYRRKQYETLKKEFE